jgi:hypothetical protein
MGIVTKKMNQFKFIIIILLLLFLGIVLKHRTASNKAQINRIEAHNNEERLKGESGNSLPVRQSNIETPENKRLMRDELESIVERTCEYAQQCITECKRNVSIISGEPDPGKDVSGIQAQDNNLNDAIQQLRNKLLSLKSIPSEFDQYRSSIYQLMDSLESLNRLRININTDKYRDELATRILDFSSKERDVKFYKPEI